MRLPGIIPKTAREIEQFYRNTIEKLKGTDTTLADEEQKSSIPFLGMLQGVQRRVNDLERNGRQVQQQNAQLSSENRQLKTRLADMERRVNDLERSI